MEIGVNWAAVGLAMLASFIVGSLWYSPLLFMEQWRKLVGLSKEDIKKGPGGRGWFFTVLAAFLQAYVLYHVTYLSDFFYTDFSWFQAAMASAFFMWLGFQLSMILTHDSFEQRRLKLSAMTAGNQLVTLLAMGLAIGLL